MNGVIKKFVGYSSICTSLALLGCGVTTSTDDTFDDEHAGVTTTADISGTFEIENAAAQKVFVYNAANPEIPIDTIHTVGADGFQDSVQIDSSVKEVILVVTSDVDGKIAASDEIAVADLDEMEIDFYFLDVVPMTIPIESAELAVSSCSYLSIPCDIGSDSLAINYIPNRPDHPVTIEFTNLSTSVLDTLVISVSDLDLIGILDLSTESKMGTEVAIDFVQENLQWECNTEISNGETGIVSSGDISVDYPNPAKSLCSTPSYAGTGSFTYSLRPYILPQKEISMNLSAQLGDSLSQVGIFLLSTTDLFVGGIQLENNGSGIDTKVNWGTDSNFADIGVSAPALLISDAPGDLDLSNIQLDIKITDETITTYLNGEQLTITFSGGMQVDEVESRFKTKSVFDRIIIQGSNGSIQVKEFSIATH